MKGIHKLFLVMVIAVFFGSGGYLLYDYMTSTKDAQDLEKLVQIVERSSQTQQAAPQTRQGPRVRVQLARQEANPASGRETAPGQVQVDGREIGQGQVQVDGREMGQGQVEANGHEDAAPSVPAAVPANDAGGLAEAVQAYLQQTIIGASQSVELIRLEIVPVAASENAFDEDAAVQESNPTASVQERGPAVTVRARVSGRVGSSSSRQAMEDEIGSLTKRYIENDESWTVLSEIIDLGVHIEPAPILPQYEALYEQNQDMIGWIKIEGTQVNYPVMQSPDDPEFYLRRNFEKESAYSGLPFMDSRCDISEPTNNLLVYGHNMKSGKMFGQLPNYESKSFWKQHPIIQFDLLNETRTYEIIGMFRSRQYKEGEEGFRYYDYIDLSEMSSFNQFMDQVKRASFIDTGVSASWGDQILTLSTCSYHANAGTFVVVAKRQYAY